MISPGLLAVIIFLTLLAIVLAVFAWLLDLGARRHDDRGQR